MVNNPDPMKCVSRIGRELEAHTEPSRTKEIIVVFGTPVFSERAWISGRFYPETQHCTIEARLTFRKNVAIVSIGGGKIMIIGGVFDTDVLSYVEMFSCRKNLSHPVASLLVPRSCHGASIVGEDVIVCGGYNGENYLKSCEIYSKGRWKLLPEMTKARWGVAVVSSPDRRVFAIGGEGFTFESSVEVCQLPFDLDSSPLPPDTAFWSSLTPMREGRCWAAAVFFQGNIFVAGGYKYGGNISSAEMLPINNEEAHWVYLPASMNEGRWDFSLVVSSREIFAFGNNTSPHNTVERLNVEGRQISNSSLNCAIEEVSATEWESLSPINSMGRIHGGVLICKVDL